MQRFYLRARARDNTAAATLSNSRTIKTPIRLSGRPGPVFRRAITGWVRFCLAFSNQHTTNETASCAFKPLEFLQIEDCPDRFIFLLFVRHTVHYRMITGNRYNLPVRGYVCEPFRVFRLVVCRAQLNGQFEAPVIDEA